MALWPHWPGATKSLVAAPALYCNHAALTGLSGPILPFHPSIHPSIQPHCSDFLFHQANFSDCSRSSLCRDTPRFPLPRCVNNAPNRLRDRRYGGTSMLAVGRPMRTDASQTYNLPPPTTTNPTTRHSPMEEPRPRMHHPDSSGSVPGLLSILICLGLTASCHWLSESFFRVFVA